MTSRTLQSSGLSWSSWRPVATAPDDADDDDFRLWRRPRDAADSASGLTDDVVTGGGEWDGHRRRQLRSRTVSEDGVGGGGGGG